MNGGTASGTVTFNEVLSVSVANNTANTIKVGTQAKATVFEPSVITVTPSGSDTGEKYTIVGLDQFGKSQTEVLTAEGAGVSVIGKKVFSKVKKIIMDKSASSSGVVPYLPLDQLKQRGDK